MPKYLNKPQRTEDGYFASKKELDRWLDLKLLEKAGKISDLKRQVTYPLIVNGFLVGKYRADAVYVENGKKVVEDVKGRREGLPYQMFKLKAAVFKAVYGQTIVEI